MCFFPNLVEEMMILYKEKIHREKKIDFVKCEPLFQTSRTNFFHTWLFFCRFARVGRGAAFSHTVLVALLQIVTIFFKNETKDLVFGKKHDYNVWLIVNNQPWHKV